jgi:hypothetical protein
MVYHGLGWVAIEFTAVKANGVFVFIAVWVAADSAFDRLDSSVDYCGVRMVEEQVVKQAPRPARRRPEPMRRPDGSPWIDNERWKEMHARMWGRRY